MRGDIQTLLDAQDQRLITAPEDGVDLALEPIGTALDRVP